MVCQFSRSTFSPGKSLGFRWWAGCPPSENNTIRSWKGNQHREVGQRAHSSQSALCPAGGVQCRCTKQAVHQRRHEPVQGRVPGLRQARLQPRRHQPEVHPRRRQATTTWTTWATPRATTPSSRCWATSASATTSSTTPIQYAWELLTVHFKLPKDKLWVTVYAEDDEAYDIWNKVVGAAAERIVRIGDNKGPATCPTTSG